jgi:hypothetical protein
MRSPERERGGAGALARPVPEPLSALEPLNGYGDALAAPPPAADPLAPPPPGPTSAGVFGPGAEGLPEAAAGAQPDAAAGSDNGIGPGLGAGNGTGILTDAVSMSFAGEPPAALAPDGLDSQPYREERRRPRPARPAAAAALPPLGPGTMALPTGIPRPPVQGGRLAAGLPRGWDPPSVPANRGWSKEVPPPAPAAPRRVALARGGENGSTRPARLRPAVFGAPGAVPAMPKELADALNRLRQRPQRRAVRSRLVAMALVALLLAQAIANRLYGGAIVFGVILLLIGLTFYRPRRRRRPADPFTQPTG